MHSVIQIKRVQPNDALYEYDLLNVQSNLMTGKGMWCTEGQIN